MVASGVENVRVVFNWAMAQPYRQFSDVPLSERAAFVDVGGVPTRFGDLDRIVALAAVRRLPVLPVVTYVPDWDARHPGKAGSPPASAKPYADFVTALVHRYGPNGDFWRQHPYIAPLPLRRWQIWNEPDLIPNWSDQPFEKDYVHLLRAAHDAVKAADPHATVVLAGMPNFAWQYLQTLYKDGARPLFDVVAVHPYTAKPSGVILFLEMVRQVMDQNGDARKPMMATEISWPSSWKQLPKSKLLGFEATERGQAKRIAQLLPLLERNRRSLRLIAFDYYTWAGVESPQAETTFDFAGVFKFRSGRFIAKPAYGAFRRGALALERCRQKGSTAASCVRAG
jgi:hypothetical protein